MSSIEIADLSRAAEIPPQLEVGKMVDPAPTVTAASYVRGVGMSVPDKVVPNSHFESYLETNDHWIRERTGIAERRWIEPEASMSDLAVPACMEAITNAGLTPQDIDGIVVATVTPENVFPSTACVLQGKLGITKGPAFDLNAVCSGFLYALTVSDGMIAAGRCSNILVVGADLFSRLIDPNDRTTCILFGDGAGAVVLSATAKGGKERFATGSGATLRGIYHAELQADGSQGELLRVPGGKRSGKSCSVEDGYLYMNGREIFKLAVRGMGDVSERVLKQVGFTSADVDYFVCHQANERILLAMARQMGIPDEKVLMNVQHYGNTSAASLPILLAEFAKKGTIKEGDLMLLTAFGGGLTWGALLLRW